MTVPVGSLHEAASAGRLLVISDYDGVVAPIVNDPAAAHPDPAVRRALLRLAALPDTDVAVLSGRARASLTALCGAVPGITLIGSHGAEADEPVELSGERRTLLAEATGALRDIGAGTEGALVEEKPTSVALHVRNVEDALKTELLEAVRQGPATWPGIRSVEGKQVIELLVTSSHKGDAVEDLRRRFAPDRIVFLGDDVTDEDAFATLGAADLGIKVGAGDTLAAARISGQEDVAGLLDELADRRGGQVGPDTGATGRTATLE